MKVGTDGVLLGCIATLPTNTASEPRILDIGAGTGLVSIMMAQRYATAKVTGVEIDPEAAAQATENCQASPFATRLTILQADIKTFAPPTGETYDLIVSNPPYFTESLQCPDGRRNIARHAVGLTFADLMAAAAKLLSPTGRVAIIIPYDAAQPLEEAAAQAGLSLVAKTTIHSNRRKPPRRAICQFEKATKHPDGAPEPEKNELTLLNLDGSNTDEYQAIARDFYLDRN